MEYPDHFTQPEPINHNELRRLLAEIVEEIYRVIPVAEVDKAFSKRYLYSKIDRFILDGDDS